MNKILVTGLSGYIGRPLIPLLNESGMDVHAICHSREILSKRITWHRCDILDSQSIIELVRKVRADTLLHMAWVTEHGQFWESNKNYLWLKCSSKLFDIFYKCGGERIIGLGSCAEYDWTNQMLLDEDSPCKPTTLYGKSKVALSCELRKLCNEMDKNYVWLRIFYPFGGAEVTTRLVPSFVKAALQKKEFQLNNPDAIRDFLYVDDCANAIYRCLKSDIGGEVDITGNNHLSLRSFLNNIAQKLDYDFESNVSYDGSCDPDIVASKSNKIFSKTSYTPTYDISKAIDKTIYFWQNNGFNFSGRLYE